MEMFVQQCCTNEFQVDASKHPIETRENLQQNFRATVREETPVHDHLAACDNQYWSGEVHANMEGYDRLLEGYYTLLIPMIND